MPSQQKFTALLGYETLLTRQLDGVNTTGQIEKRFRAQVSGTELIVTETKGCVEAEPREGEPTATRPFPLLYMTALGVLQPALRGPRRAAGSRVSTVTA